MTVVIVFARLTASPVADVRAVLSDWVAAGLVDSPLWIDADQPTGSGRQVLGLEHGVGGDRSVPVDLWLTGHDIAATGAGLRLACLQILGSAADALPVEPVARLREELGLPSLQLLNVIAILPGLTEAPSEVLFDSQRNVLLQPVDAQDPAGAGSVVSGGSWAAMHTAAGLATVAGLWTAADEAPHDRDHPWPGRRIQLARCYLRSLDGSEVLEGLTAAVLDDNGGRPLSRSQHGQPYSTVVPEARVATAEAVAHTLVDGSPVASYQPLPPPPTPPKKQVTPGTAITDFGSFLAGALLRAPGEWVARKVESVQAGVSSRLTSALYGKDGAYEVVMGRAGGRPAGVAAAADGAQWLVSQLSPGSEAPSPDAQALWRAEVSAAVALVDGSTTAVAQMPHRGTQRLVIGDPGAVAPAPGTAPFRIQAGLLRGRGPVFLEPNDPFAARQVMQELQDIQRAAADWSSSWGGSGWGAAQPGMPGGPNPQNLGAQAGLVAGDLRQWLEAQRSFTVAMSDQIGAGIRAAQADQEQLLAAAQAQEVAQARAAAAEEAVRTRRRLLGWVLGLLLATVLVVVLAVVGVLAGPLLAIVAVLVGLGWLAGALLTFVRSSRRYYQLIHALDVLSARRAWADSHSLEVPRAIIRLADVYRRSRQWGDVVADLVHDPFCRDARAADRSGAAVRLTGSLPHSMAIGHLPFNAQDYRSEAFRATAMTLQPGWLDVAEAERRALALTVRSGQTGGREHETVWSSDGTENSALADLVLALRDPRFRTTHHQNAVNWLTGKVTAGGLDLKTARIDAGRTPREVPAADFIAQLATAVPVPHQEGMSAVGVQRGSADVAATHLWGSGPGAVPAAGRPVPGGGRRRIVGHSTRPAGGRRLLDRVVIRCDLTDRLDPGDVDYFGAASGGAGDDDGTRRAGGPEDGIDQGPRDGEQLPELRSRA